MSGAGSRPEWYDILRHVAEQLEKDFRELGHNFKVVIEEGLVFDVVDQINRNMDKAKMKPPHASKIAGLVAFWICRLKPFYIQHASPEIFRFINELVGLKVGLAICQKYTGADQDRPVHLHLDERILSEWMMSARYHSYSLASFIIAFELLASQPSQPSSA